MQRNLFIIAMCLAVFAYAPTSMLFPTQAYADKPFALLLSCDGDVVILRGGQTIKGSFGLQLSEGDEVVTQAGAAASIIWANGSTVQLGSGSKIQIGSQKPSQSAESPTTVGEKGFQTVQNFIRLKDSEGTTSMAKLRSGEKRAAIVAISPTLTVIRDGQPTFRWSGADEETELQLTVYGDASIVWQADVTGMTSVQYPEDAPPLQPGASYSWTVETADPLQSPPLRSATAFFGILYADESEELDGQLASLSIEEMPNEATYYLVRASLFYEYGLAYDAILATREAVAIDQDDATLRSILAHLYAEVGMTEEAFGEYNRILQTR